MLQVPRHKFWGAVGHVTFIPCFSTKPNYDWEAYGSPRQCQLHAIDTMHHTGCRIATGVFRTRPVASLFCEAGFNQGTFQSQTYHTIFALCYCFFFCKTRFHCSSGFLQQQIQAKVRQGKPGNVRPFKLRIRDLHRDLEFEMPVTASLVYCAKTRWTLPCSRINSKLTILSIIYRSNTSEYQKNANLKS